MLGVVENSTMNELSVDVKLLVWRILDHQQGHSGRQNLWNDFNHGVPERGVWEQVCPNNFEQSQIGPSEIEHNWCREWDTKR